DGGSQGELRGGPGGLGEAGDVTEHGGVHVHTGGEGGHIGHGTGGDHRGQGGGAVLHGGAGEDLHGGVLVRVAQGGAHQEPVQLGLREAVGTGLLDRVLGGEHDERRRDVVRLPVDGDASFFHHLQQRRLSLRRRAVDLIGEYHGGEDGAVVELEALGLLVVDRHAGDVRGQQVRCELDARVAGLHRGGYRTSQGGLARAGEVLQQQVPAGEQAGQGQSHHVILA